MPPSPRSQPPPQSSPDQQSPLGFAPVDPMEAPPSSSRQPVTLVPTTPLGKPAAPAASGVKASAPSSPGPSNASTPKTASTSSTPGTEAASRSTPATFDAAKFQRIFRGLVGGAGALANEKLTRDDLARDRGLWLTDNDDEADIGDPLGSITVRHLGLAKLKNIEDAEDLINLLAATAAYITANVRKSWLIARERRLARLAQHTRVDELDNEGATS